ncbi:MAG: nucleotide exchange factor GrpE [Clostridia bacterium]|nr:nucleotide exchange factor GrpE [Clostridia bacterium]
MSEKQKKNKQEAEASENEQPAEEVKKDVKEEAAEDKPAEPTELEKAQAAAEDYKRKWYSVSAEYDNYRKRNAASVSQAYADCKAEAVLKLLPVSDTFGWAMDSTSDEATRAGIDKVIKNFNSILASMDVHEIELKEGDPFDESVAEAVMNVPCEEGEAANTVKHILKKGYRSGAKVIRFAQVAVTAE